MIYDESVSRYHSEISYKNGEFCLFDKGSTSGTFIKIEKPLEIKKKMILEIGSYQFKVNKISLSQEN